MRTSTKVMATLGIVSGLGASLIPIGSLFALDPTAQTSDDTKSVTLNATVSVANAISVTDPDTIAVTPNSSTIATSSSVVTATSNRSAGYYVNVAMNSTTTNLVNSDHNNTPIPANASLGEGTNGWAIRCTDCSNTNWQAVPGSSSTPLALTTKGSSSSAAGDTYHVDWGVTVDGTIIAGSYTGTVVFTIGPNS